MAHKLHAVFLQSFRELTGRMTTDEERGVARAVNDTSPASYAPVTPGSGPLKRLPLEIHRHIIASSTHRPSPSRPAENRADLLSYSSVSPAWRTAAQEELFRGHRVDLYRGRSPIDENLIPAFLRALEGDPEFARKIDGIDLGGVDVVPTVKRILESVSAVATLRHLGLYNVPSLALEVLSPLASSLMSFKIKNGEMGAYECDPPHPYPELEDPLISTSCPVLPSLRRLHLELYTPDDGFLLSFLNRTTLPVLSTLISNDNKFTDDQFESLFLLGVKTLCIAGERRSPSSPSNLIALSCDGKNPLDELAIHYPSLQYLQIAPTAFNQHPQFHKSMVRDLTKSIITFKTLKELYIPNEWSNQKDFKKLEKEARQRGVKVTLQAHFEADYASDSREKTIRQFLDQVEGF